MARITTSDSKFKGIKRPASKKIKNEDICCVLPKTGQMFLPRGVLVFLTEMLVIYSVFEELKNWFFRYLYITIKKE